MNTFFTEKFFRQDAAERLPENPFIREKLGSNKIKNGNLVDPLAFQGRSQTNF